MRTLNQRIGTRLKFLREEAGISSEQMAALLDVTESHYKKIERGVYELRADKLVILRKSIGADPLFLLTGENRFRLNTPREELPGRELRVMQDLFRYCSSVSGAQQTYREVEKETEPAIGMKGTAGEE